MTLLAVSLAASDTSTALEIMGRAVGLADLVELRLDLMAEFDLARLLEKRPLPVIATCRPAREGGRWAGSESARLQVLREAASLGAEYVDLEWDVAHLAASLSRSGSQLILSRHDFQAMPKDWAAQSQTLWEAGADVVKLVGTARRLADTLPVLNCLANAPGPTIAIAMGTCGVPTRLLAFRYRQGFLSFAAPGRSLEVGAPLPSTGRQGQEHAKGMETEPGRATASGQISAQAMQEVYRVRTITAETAILGLVANGAKALPMLVEGNGWLASQGLDAVLVPLPLGPDEPATEAMAALAQVIPLAGWLAVSFGAGRLEVVPRSEPTDPRRRMDSVIEELSWILRGTKG